MFRRTLSLVSDSSAPCSPYISRWRAEVRRSTTHVLIASAFLLVLVGAPPILAQQAPIASSACAVQGAGDRSPLLGRTVTVTGVVTADFLDTERYGFALQAPGCDADPATSDGVWVYDPKGVEVPAEVAVGRCVTVTGEVDEYSGLTEIVLAAGGVEVGEPCAVPEAQVVAPPADVDAAIAYLEARESMWVALEPSVVVAATNHFSEAYVVARSSVGPDLPSWRVFRGAPDGAVIGLQTPGWWLTLDQGDEITDATGTLTYNYEKFKVMLPEDRPPTVVRGNREPDRALPAGAGDLTIATYNIENLFDPVDNPGKNDEDSTPSPELYARMLGVRACSIFRDLGAPDIVGLQEVENERVLIDLAAHILELAAPSPGSDGAGPDYAPALVEGPDARGIDVAFLYRRDKLRLLTVEQRQACSTVRPSDELVIPCRMPDGTAGNLLFGRPPLVGRFEVIATGGRVNLIVNHFKSKGGGDALTVPIRTAMAAHIVALARELRTAEPDVPTIVLGDLNDFEDSAPLQVLTGSGLLRDLHGVAVPPPDRYTYVYNGLSQILDYVLVGPDLPYTEFRPVHVNTDFGTVPDGLLRGTCGTGEAHEHASDHDPVFLRVPQSALPVPAVRGTSVYLPSVLRNSRIDAADEPAGTGTPPPQAGTPTSGIAPTPTGVFTAIPTVSGTTTPHATPTGLLPTPTAPRTPTQPPSTQVPPTVTQGVPTPSPTAVVLPTDTPGAGAPPRTPLRIDTVFYDGEKGATEPDEYVAFTNVTGAVVDLTGWQLISVQGDQRYRFPDGDAIAGGATCRVYTNETHTEWCALDWMSNQAVWRNGGDKAELRDANGALVDWWCYGNMEDQCGG